jgi:hypothetical protein
MRQQAHDLRQHSARVATAYTEPSPLAECTWYARVLAVASEVLYRAALPEARRDDDTAATPDGVTIRSLRNGRATIALDRPLDLCRTECFQLALAIALASLEPDTDGDKDDHRDRDRE